MSIAESGFTAMRPTRRFLSAGDGVGLLAIVWLMVLIAMPAGVIFVTSVFDGNFTLSHYGDFFASARLRNAAANSIIMSVAIAILSVLIGGALAFGVSRTNMRYKVFVRVSMIIALISPEFLLTMGYILVAGPNAGLFNIALRSTFGEGGGSGPLNIFSIWGLILTALPNGVSFVFLTMTPAFSNMDPALEEAARMKGASAAKAIRTVTLPLMRPAILSGGLLAFASSLATYGPPQLLGVETLTVSIRDALVDLNFSLASVAAVVLVVLSMAALTIQRYCIRRAERYRTLGGKSFRARTINLGWGTTALSVVAAIYAIVALIIPYGSLLMASFLKSVGNGLHMDNWTLANYYVVLTDQGIYDASVLSAGIAAVCATMVVATGIAVSYVLVRTKLFARSALDYLSVMPLAIPGTALAFALVVSYLNWPLNLTGFYGTPAILLIAYLARFIPIGVRNCQAGLLQIAPELEEASRVAGHSEWKTVRSITIPLLIPSIIYTWVLTFILTIPELSASIILRGFGTQTVSTALIGVWNGNGGLPVASAFGIVIFVLIGSLFGLASLALRKSRHFPNTPT